jgi:hypothetical protein
MEMYLCIMSEINLPTDKWNILGNEEHGELDITSIDNQGNSDRNSYWRQDPRLI